MRALIPALVLLLDAQPLLAADAMVPVYLKESSSAGQSRYELTIHNTSDLAITALEIGKKHGCLGDPVLPQGLVVSGPASSQAAAASIQGRSSYLWQGRIEAGQRAQLVVSSAQPLSQIQNLALCVYRAEAQVDQYKAAIRVDNEAPVVQMSLNPSSLAVESRFVPVEIQLQISDASPVEVKLSAVTSNWAGFDAARDLRDLVIGSDDRSFQVNAEREQILSFRYEVQDAAGQQTVVTQSLTIFKPQDRQPPQLSVVIDPAVIKPNNKFVSVEARIQLSDDTDARPKLRLKSISAADRGFVYASDVKGASLGTDDRNFQLMAELATGGAVRTYRVTYEAEDASGNVAVATATVEIKNEPVTLLQKIVSAVVSLLQLLLSLFR